MLQAATNLPIFDNDLDEFKLARRPMVLCDKLGKASGVSFHEALEFINGQRYRVMVYDHDHLRSLSLEMLIILHQNKLGQFLVTDFSVMHVVFRLVVSNAIVEGSPEELVANIPDVVVL